MSSRSSAGRVVGLGLCVVDQCTVSGNGITQVLECTKDGLEHHAQLVGHLNGRGNLWMESDQVFHRRRAIAFLCLG